MMKKILAALALLLLAALPANAQIISPLPYTLTNGTVADADEVMSNFNQIRSDCNTNCAKAGANSDITSLSGLTSTLSAPAFAPTTNTPGTNNLFRISAGIPAISSGSSETIRFDDLQNVIIRSQARVSTTASNGFLYFPTTLGLPTGTPTSYPVNAPAVIDATNNAFYFYTNNGWRNAAGAGAITQIVGTAAQISVSTVASVATLSIPSIFQAPGSITATSGISAGTTVSAAGIISSRGSELGGLAIANQWTAGQAGRVSQLTEAASISFDLSTGNNYKLALAANRTLANATNAVSGQSGIIAVTQSGAGGSLTFGSNYVSTTAPTFTTTASAAVDYLTYYVETPTRIFVSVINNIK